MAEAFLLREPRPGDYGWVVSRHGALYAAEYGFNQRFEGLVAEVVGGFVRNFDAARERCWIAEKDGAPVGSVFLVKESDTAAKLRLLLVEPTARGLGVGQLLVGECIDTACALGYRGISLWTQNILVAARHIYAQSGFRLVRSEPHEGFGYPLVGEYWELEL
jgi:GNAT superfamily N-acetyltransferase